MELEGGRRWGEGRREVMREERRDGGKGECEGRRDGMRNRRE